MPPYRDHQPIAIDKFNGLWRRGDRDNCPLDHFDECNNIISVGDRGIRPRDGIAISQDVALPISNVRRIYNFPTDDGNTLIVLGWDDVAEEGTIYHVTSPTTVFSILTIADMTDFAFVPYAGRGYISPFTSFAQGDLWIEKGLEDEFLYVYMGDGTNARKAAGTALSGSMTVANGAAGHTDAGIHIFGFVVETDSGYLSAPGLLTQFTTSALSSVSFGSVDTSPSPGATRRHLVATKKITSFNGNLTGYQFYFVPDATIDNNTDTFLNNISFYDQDLIEDASYLLDNYAEIPAGAVLSFYHNRLVLAATFDDMSLALVSTPGEPEAIDQINGIIEVKEDGNPITNAQELRDVLYIFKRSRTISYPDNGDHPITWPDIVVDTALGTSVHGVATVLDSGASSVDYLIIGTYQGVSIFNGRYITPELSYKIEDFWRDLDRVEFRKIQILNAPIQKWILIILPDNTMLCGDYGNGMDPKKIKWWPWSFNQGVNTVAIHNIDDIILGSEINT